MRMKLKLKLQSIIFFGRMIRNLLAHLKTSILETFAQTANLTDARHWMTIL